MCVGELLFLPSLVPLEKLQMGSTPMRVCGCEMALKSEKVWAAVIAVVLLEQLVTAISLSSLASCLAKERSSHSKIVHVSWSSCDTISRSWLLSFTHGWFTC